MVTCICIYPVGESKVEYRNIIDTHIHSDNSKDAHHSVTLICEQAVKKGVRAIAVTDHCECIEYEEYNHAVTCRQSVFETVKVRKVFEGQLAVATGVELGCPARNIDAVNDVMKNKFDFVLASVHRIRGKKKGFYHLDYKRDSNRPELLMPRYFDDIIETVEWNGFDSLAHLTYPLRCFPAEQLADFSIMQCRDQIYYILETLARNKKALEINTSGGRIVTKDIETSLFPPLEILKLFKKLGGEYVTVGSDAHSAYDVGRGIADAYDAALAAGFEYVTYYEGRVPLQLKIE